MNNKQNLYYSYGPNQKLNDRAAGEEIKLKRSESNQWRHLKFINIYTHLH